MGWCNFLLSLFTSENIIMKSIFPLKDQDSTLLDLNNSKLVCLLRFVHFKIFQASALSIRETYGRLNLLINASGILSIPEVIHPGKSFVSFFNNGLIISTAYCSFLEVLRSYNL